MWCVKVGMWYSPFSYTSLPAGYKTSHTTPVHWYYACEADCCRLPRQQPWLFQLVLCPLLCRIWQDGWHGVSQAVTKITLVDVCVPSVGIWVLPCPDIPHFHCQIISRDLWPNPLKCYVKSKVPQEESHRETVSSLGWDRQNVLSGIWGIHFSSAETEAQRNATSASRSGGQQDDLGSLHNCRAYSVLTWETYGGWSSENVQSHSKSVVTR